MQQGGKMKNLELNRDYGYVFGISAEKGEHMIYLGGIKFRAEKPGAVREQESQGTYDKISAYLNQTVRMGM
jgi:hypothetical protein